jgi:acetyltransferase-like isoleucine patch superfamily enzyme
MRLKILGSMLLFVLPWSVRRRLLNRLFGYRIAPTARIGFSLVLLDELVLEEGARIGHLNLIKSFDRLEMLAMSKIGNRNHISGIGSRNAKHFGDETGRSPEIILGEHASITGHHMIDCCNRIEIGRFTTIAGAGTHILTHAISIKRNRQVSAPVRIGQYCFVGAASVVLKGAILPDFSVLAANSTLHRAFEETHGIYSGVPAERVRALDADCAYFERKTGYVP